MLVELSREDAEMLRDLLQQRILELDKEINRTDSFSFKEQLRHLDRVMERVLRAISTVLAGPPRTA
jgi:predicted transcriptional regulator